MYLSGAHKLGIYILLIIGGFHMNANGEDVKVLPLVGNAIKQITEKIKNGDFNIANITKPLQLTCKLSMLEAVAKF
jgi:hypothetical protein